MGARPASPGRLPDFGPSPTPIFTLLTIHPASLLLAWLSLALALQWFPLAALLGLAALIFPLASWRAGTRFRLLLRRARWLLLSIVILFALATPGSALPGAAGALGLTHEGAQLAAAHVLRLTLLLGLLAMLLEQLGIPALIAGLYTLLAPLGRSRRRSQMALRLLLVLEYVEQGRVQRRDDAQQGWRYWLDPQTTTTGAHAVPDTLTDYPPIELHVAPLGAIDLAVILLALVGLGAAYGCTSTTP